MDKVLLPRSSHFSGGEDPEAITIELSIQGKTARFSYGQDPSGAPGSKIHQDQLRVFLILMMLG